MNTKQKIYFLVFGMVVLLLPVVVFAQTLNSSTYSVEGSTIDGGGQSSSSTNYTSHDSIGAELETGETASSTYSFFGGFLNIAYPGVPAQPSLTNTTGTMYNSLDFVVATGNGQQSDTVYAIAISDDDFTTTQFIQSDDTLGASEAWQSYTDWGSGTGETVTGLSPNTTYKIKVKARYGADSESGYSVTASASTTGQILTAAISGVASSTSIAGLTTTVTSTATNIGFGGLTIGDGSPNIAAQGVTVTTNATGGYTTTIRQDGNLRTGYGDEIATVSGTNASPAAFGTGVTTGRFGYHTTDSALCTGTTSRFSSNDTYAALETSPYEIACSTGPVTSELTQLVFKLVIGTLQPAGDYQNSVTYVTTATY
ncbi:MAG: hypothetical protein R3B41_00695 [Candidatus Doudnabacteria bacterium]